MGVFIFVGLDLSLPKASVCVVDRDGAVLQVGDDPYPRLSSCEFP